MTATAVRPHLRPGRASCTLDDCDGGLYARGLCVMHYAREMREGSAGEAERRRRPRGEGHINADGYLILCRPGHPLAGAQGKVRANRVVLFDQLGPGEHPCHWCGVELPWQGEPSRRINADHLDGDTLNNDPANLVPACLACNTGRA